MKKAFRLFDKERGLEGGHELVTASDLRKMKKEEAAQLSFLCCHPGCYIKVIPVFPETEHQGKVRDCHFRASPGTTHISHGTPANSTHAAASSTNGGHGKIAGWRDARPKRQAVVTIATQGKVRTTDGDDFEETSSKGDDSSSGSRRSLTGVLQKLVDRWDSEQPNIQDETIDIDGCKDKTWGQVFLSVGADLASHGLGKPPRSVFHGPISDVRRYGSHAFKIIFSEKVEGRTVSCYFIFPLEDQRARPTMTKLLVQKHTNQIRYAYALGVLVPRNKNEFNIEVKLHAHVLIATKTRIRRIPSRRDLPPSVGQSHKL